MSKMNTINKNTLCSWSGGKDSCFALMQSIINGYTPVALLNVLNEAGKISRSHGIPAAILQQQAAAANLPIHLISSSWADYENNFTGALQLLQNNFNAAYAVFGDIDLQPHRDWEEKVCTNADLTALLPLWQQDRKALVLQMIASNIKTIIVSCNQTLGKNFLGRLIDKQCVADLEKAGVDVCGENGEFHTLVLNCPLFNQPLQVNCTATILHENYWFTQLESA